MRGALLSAFLLAAACAPPAAPPPPSITPSSIRAHMGFLAHDLLEGRMPGTRGYRLVADAGERQRFHEGDFLGEKFARVAPR